MTDDKGFMDVLSRLQDFFPLKDPDPEAFDDAVASLAELNDARAIREVLSLADDACPYAGLMASMLESLEGFPAATLVDEFVSCAPSFRVRSPKWYMVELQKLIWSSPHSALLAEKVAGLTDSERSVFLAEVIESGARIGSMRGAADAFVEKVRSRQQSV